MNHDHQTNPWPAAIATAALLLLQAFATQPVIGQDPGSTPMVSRSTHDDSTRNPQPEDYANVPDVAALLADIADAGSREVVADHESRALYGFLDRLEVALTLTKAAALNGAEPSAAGPTTLQALDLIRQAASYGEAKLLVQEAFGAGAEHRAVPAELSADPNDPDWVFGGNNPSYPEIVADALDIRRQRRDRVLDQLDDEDFERYAAGEADRLFEQRRELAHATGRAFDPRDDLYVAVLNNDQIWRRKKPTDYVPSAVDREAPGGLRDAAPSFPELDQPGGADAGHGGPAKAVFGTDTRQLRSKFNGFNMQSTVWMPKGAILPLANSSNGNPINVDCTGVKIRERLVVTSGHCLFKNGSWNTNRKWLPGADGIADVMGTTNDPSPNGYKSSYRRLVRSQWFDHEWSNYDFGIFVLYDNSSSCYLPWHGWWKKSGLLNDTIYLYGYPGETQDCDASPLNSDNCYGSIYGAGGSITYAGAYRVRYAIDTQPGQSGTGFYEIDGGSRYVVGVHRGQNSGSRNDGVRISSGVRDIINDAKADYPPNAC